MDTSDQRDTLEDGKPADPPERRPLARWARYLREAAALVFWGFIFTKAFVVDVDLLLLERWAPGWLPFAQYRLLALLAFVALLWLFLGNRRFAQLVLYVLLYPLVVLLWKLPRALFRNWTLLVAFSPALHALVRTFRWSFIWATAAILSASLILLVGHPPTVITAMVVLGLFLLFYYWKRLRVAFQPRTVFADGAELVRTLWEGVQDIDFIKSPAPLDAPKGSVPARGMDLFILYVFSKSLGHLGMRLRAIAESRKLDVYYICSLVFTFLLTWIVFAIEYVAVEKLWPESFSGPQPLGLGAFLGYSFSTLVTSGISPVTAAGDLARWITYSQLCGSLAIMVLLLFVVLTSIRERYHQDLDAVISELSNTSQRFEAHIRTSYSCDIVAAEKKLHELVPDMMKMLHWVQGKGWPKDKKGLTEGNGGG